MSDLQHESRPKKGPEKGAESGRKRQRETRHDTELLRRAVVELRQLKARVAELESTSREPVALIGIGCRFPGPDGAATVGPDAFWQQLAVGVDAIGPLPADRFDETSLVDDPDVAAGGERRRREGGFLPRVDGFDAAFFGIAPREALAMDPQQRLLLETSWHALEHANLAPDSLYGSRTGVWVGISGLDWVTHLARRRGALDLYAGTGAALSVAAGRVAYALGLTGPAVAIDTACSSSLVAVHEACRALRLGDCDVALAAGVHLMLAPESTVVLDKMSALAADGRCKTFDQAADGFGRGEGCGVVVLKRLREAQADGDPVIAVLRGSAVNHDGASGGLTVPNGPAQQAVIRRALAVAGAEPETVDYVEAHGTGTPLGDPIEIRSLGAVFGPGRRRERPLLVGSVKTNIGHLEAAAGVAGLIKVALALEHGTIPPHLHFARPSPHMPWRTLPLEIPRAATPWPDGEGPRRAGISAFGFSGTNAHLVVEAAPTRTLGADDGSPVTESLVAKSSGAGPRVLTLSAATASALRTIAGEMARCVVPPDGSRAEPGSATDLARIVAVASCGRAQLAHRLAIRATDADGLASALHGFATTGAHPRIQTRHVGDPANAAATGSAATPGTRVAFVFGASVLDVAVTAATLAGAPEGFRRAFAACLKEIRPILDEARSRCFAAAWAHAETLRAAGVEPAAVCGEGAGAELAAALAEEQSRQAAAERLVAETRSIATGSTRVPVRGAVPRVATAAEARDLGCNEMVLMAAGWQSLEDTLAALFVAGVDIDWSAIYGPGLDRSPRLPTYPFEHQRFWHQEPTPVSRANAPEGDLYYHLDWQQQPLATTTQGVGAGTCSGTWMLVAVDTDAPVVSALAAALDARGAQCQIVASTMVSRDDELEKMPRGIVLLDTTAPAASAGRGATPEGVDAATMLESVARRADTVVDLLHLLGQQEPDRTRGGRLWVVTRGAVSVHGSSPRHGSWLAGASLWGLGRVAALEHPDRWGGLIDLGAKPVAGEGAWLADELAASDRLVSGPIDSGPVEPGATEQVALRSGGRWLARLERLPPEELRTRDSVSRLALDGEATYLISGGLGRLGLLVAGWLVARGARHLVLIGRRPPRTEALATLDALRAAGATVESVALDLADGDAVAGLLADLDGQGRTLRGIVHAAGVSEVRALADLDPQSMRAVLRPKVAGGWALHTQTRHCPLDFFVTFSSIASVWGSRQQGHYAAANAFLDALADHRHALGLPALSVSWGLWSAETSEASPPAGMGSAATQRWLERSGIRRLEPAVALAALETLLATDQHRVTVADIDWRRLLPLFSLRGPHPVFAALTPASRDAPRAGTGLAGDRATWRSQLVALPPARRRAPLVSRLQQAAGEVLGFGRARPQEDQHEGQGHPDELPSPNVGFFDLGMDSLTAVELRDVLARELDLDLPASITFDHPSIDRLADHLLGHLPQPEPVAAESVAAGPVAAAPEVGRVNAAGAVDSLATTDSLPDEAEGALAVVGIGCRFPGGGEDPERFWDLLRTGTDTVAEVPAGRWDVDAVFDPSPGVPGKTYTRHGAFLDAVDQFDPQAFGISAREARALDPQQRLLLEVVWEALERAGLTRQRLAGSRTGVFVGITTNDYGMMLAERGDDALLDGYFGSGNTLNAAAGRISYVFGLRGPSLAVDTACSSSLVAVHLARQSLLTGECDLAIAAGVNLVLGPRGSIALSQARMLAPDGRSKGFSARADGYGRGEGCGVVVLERLADAGKKGDPVLARVLGSAVNQDGASSGFTVPNGSAQESLLRQALASAGVAANEIGYLEAHGTGTPLGDPIEVRAATAVLGRDRPPDRPLLLGSVKSNLGHLESAAGIAGLIKAVLAVHRAEIPPHLHGDPPNPHLPWDTLPVTVVDQLRAWPKDGLRRLAGVSSFGASGTNAHVIVAAEAPEITPEASRRADGAGEASTRAQVLALSARSPAALAALVARYEDWLSKVWRPTVDLFTNDTADLATLCAAVANGRTAHEHRLALVATTREEMLEALAAARGAASERRASPTPGISLDLPTVADVPAVAQALEQCRLDLGSSLPPLDAVSAPANDDTAVDVCDAAGWRRLCERLAAFWQAGVEIAWQALPFAAPRSNGDQRRIELGYGELPTYPFQRGRYWLPDPPTGPSGYASPPVQEQPVRALRDALVAVHWQEAPCSVPSLADGAADGVTDEPGAWLLVGEGAGAGAAVAMDLEARGQIVQTIEDLGRTPHVPDTTEAALREALVELGTHTPVRGIVYLGALDTPTLSHGTARSAAPIQAQQRLLGTALDALRALAARAGAARLWLVTAGVASGDASAQASLAQASLAQASLAQATLWGLARVIALEQPMRWGGLIDLDPVTGSIVGLADELLRRAASLEGPSEDRVALRGGKRLVARLRPWAARKGVSSSISTAHDEPLRADATYLIAGGLGALGRAVADGMVTRGARYLALLGRHGATRGNAERFLADLRARGVTVCVPPVDIADHDALARTLDTLRREAPPIRGVVHAAGVIDDGVLTQLDEPRLAGVLAPKVAGGWYLHVATREDPLDFFVVFSSLASLLGSPGQGSYAAANAFLDSLVSMRRLAGLPALSIQWGPWDEAGMAARVAASVGNSEGPGRRLPAETGLTPIPPTEGVDTLFALLAVQDAVPQGQVGAVIADWATLARRFRAQSPFLSELVPADGAASEGSAAAPSASLASRGVARVASLATAPTAQRVVWLRDHLCEVIASALGFTADELPEDRGFADLGMDSLTVVSLSQQLNELAGRVLPASLLFNYPTLDTLSDHLATVLWPSSPADAPSPGDPRPDASVSVEPASGQASPGQAASDHAPSVRDAAPSEAADVDTLSEAEAMARIAARVEAGFS